MKAVFDHGDIDVYHIAVFKLLVGRYDVAYNVVYGGTDRFVKAVVV